MKTFPKHIPSGVTVAQQQAEVAVPLGQLTHPFMNTYQAHKDTLHVPLSHGSFFPSKQLQVERLAGSWKFWSTSGDSSSFFYTSANPFTNQIIFS